MASNSFKVKNSLNLTPQASEPSGLEVGDLWADLNGKIYRYDGSGSKEIGSSQGGINYIENSDFESNAAGWSAYKDAAQAVVVDGTAGTPTGLTIARSTSSPLRGTGSGLIAKTASASRQGEGASTPFTIDSADQAKVLEVSFDYTASANYVDGDVRVYVYDVTNAAVIELSQRDLLANSGQATYRGFFQAASNSTSYRLIYHVATSTTLAYDIKIDNVKVGPAQAIESGNVVAFRAFLSSGANHTALGAYQKVPINSVEFDTSGAWDLANNRWNCPESGYYNITGQVGFASITATNATFSSIRINNVNSAVGNVFSTGANTAITLSTASCIKFLNKGDYVELFAFQNDSASESYSTGAVNTSFSIAKIASDQASAGSSVVACRATSGSSQTVATNNSTVGLQPNTVTFDTAGGFDAVNYRYAIPESGIYQIRGRVEVQATNVLNDRYRAAIRLNGSGIFNGDQRIVNASQLFTTDAMGVGFFNKGDLIDLALFGAGNNSVNTLTINAGGAILEIYKLSSPAIIPPTEFVGCSYRTNSGQSTTSGNTLLFEIKDYDSHNSYNVSTGIYTVPITGIYEFSVSTYTTNIAASTVSSFYGVDARNTTNSTSKYIAYDISATTSARAYSAQGSTTRNLNKGDQIAFRLLNNLPSGNLTTSQNDNWMSITKVG
jgi:hypothetical protein